MARSRLSQLDAPSTSCLSLKQCSTCFFFPPFHLLLLLLLCGRRAGGPKWMAALMDPTYDITWNILLFRGTRFLTRRAGRRWLFGKDSQEK